MPGSCKLVYNKKSVPDIEAYIPALIRIKRHVAGYAFPGPVEVNAYQMTISIYYRTA
jgi:hypothetical protein